MSAPAKCSICAAPDAKSCAKCGSSSYCSDECQEKDWPTHKLVCKQFNAYQGRGLQARPVYKSALFFPTEQDYRYKGPLFKWVTVRNVFEGGVLREQVDPRQLKDLMSGGTPVCEMAAAAAASSGEARNLEIWFRDDFLMSSSPKNQTVAAVTGGTTFHCWRGPLLVMAYGPGKNAADLVKYGDVTPAAFRDVVGFLSNFRREDG